MQAEELFEKIGELDDKTICEAREAPHRRDRRGWIWAAAGACAAVIVLALLLPKWVKDREQIPGSESAPKQTGEEPQAPAGNYPYNDDTVLDYIGYQLDGLEVNGSRIVLNEITDIEAYRTFNTVEGYRGRPYYSTVTTVYDLLTGISVSDENSFLNITLFEKDGSLENCPAYEKYLRFSEDYPAISAWIRRLMETGTASAVSEYLNLPQKAAGLFFRPADNCAAMIVSAQDLKTLDSRYGWMVSELKAMLGTEKASSVNGQELAAAYFYQNRLFQSDKTEEAFRYYVYFEREGEQFLLQFSSNWALVGQSVTALHNPPKVLSTARSQEACRTLFAECLDVLLQ